MNHTEIHFVVDSFIIYSFKLILPIGICKPFSVKCAVFDLEILLLALILLLVWEFIEEVSNLSVLKSFRIFIDGEGELILLSMNLVELGFLTSEYSFIL